MTAGPPPPQVRPTATSQPFWDGLAAGEVRIQCCDACGTWIHYPRNRCVSCFSAQLSFRAVEPVGTVHTFAVADVPTAPWLADRGRMVIAVVELDIGVRLTTDLVDVDPDDVHVGLRVEGVFRPDAGATLLLFRPAG